MRPVVAMLVSMALVLGACSSGASTCDELADEAIVLVQDLIDDVEAELGDTGLDELVDSAGDLPSLAAYERKSEKVDARAEELGCSRTEMRDLVAARADRLEATTPVGNLIVDGITTAGL